MLKKKGGELKNVDIKEVSFVDRPANQKRFLFVKDADGNIEKAITGIEIVTEGTQEATISINGVEIEDLTGFYFSYQKPIEGEGHDDWYWPPIYAYYTVETDEDVGFAWTTKYLTKGKEREEMENAQLIELAKQYGITMTPEMIEKAGKESLDAWECLSGFPIPAPLAKAIGVIVKSQETPTIIEPPVSAVVPTAKEIAEAVILAQSDGEPPAETPKPVVEDDALKKAKEERADLIARIEKLEKGEVIEGEEDGEDPPAPEVSAELKALQDSNAEMRTRLEVVEKSAGVVKGLGDPAGGTEPPEADKYSSIDLGLQ